MPSRAATFPDVSSFRARPYTGRDYRRSIVGGAVLGLGGASAAAMMAGTAAVAAAWMVSSLLSNNAEFRASAPITMGARLPAPEMRLAAPTDMFGGALAAANPAYAPAAERNNKVAVAATPSAAEPAPHSRSKPRPQVIARVPLPRARPMQFAEVEARLQAEAQRHIAHVAPVPAAPLPQIAAAAPASAPAVRPAQPAPQNAEATYGLASADVVPPPHVAPAPHVAPPPAHPMQFAEVQAKLEAEARPHIVRVISIPAASSPQIAAPEPRVAAPAPSHAPNGEGVYTLASADVVPPLPDAPAPRHARRGEATYSLASADTARPVTTGSIGAIIKPMVPTAPAPAKPAAPVLAYANPDVPARDNHTAIYDIVSHVVYMPDGERLEAHSGLGRMLDDPHYASAKARGPTPPNVYDLTLRSGLFHGVQALRLNPVAGSKMYGRDGILAHTYMLGPSGASFGCVSFKHYDSFLQAYRRGEVNRIVVVPHLQEPPPGVRADAGNKERYAANAVKDY
jgi:hypothetical protein